MLRRRGRTRTIASLIAMAVAVVVGFYTEAHIDELGTALDRPLEAQEPAATVEGGSGGEAEAESRASTAVLHVSRAGDCGESTTVLVHPVPPATL